MAKKKSNPFPPKNVVKPSPTPAPQNRDQQINVEIQYEDDHLLPKKSLFRVDEVAAYFDVSVSTIYLWIDHGILMAEQYRRVKRIPRESILSCRFASKLNPLE